MAKHSSTIIPNSIMGNKGNVTIAKLMWTKLNQLISMKQMTKANISLAMRAWLNSQNRNTQVNI